MVARFKTELLEDTHIAGQFSHDHGTTTGITFGIRPGFFTLNDRVEEIAAALVSLVDNDTNFVYIDWAVTPAVIATKLSDWPGGNYTPCYKVTTVAAAITVVEDWRVRRLSANVVAQ